MATTNNYVKFLKGTYAKYQAIATKDPNHIYITTDEGGIYLGDKRLGDYILVDSVSALTSDTSLVKSTGALYYAQKENVLARWNGSDWVQINAAGLTEVTVTGAADGDYIGNVTVNTNANGTARALTINKQKLADHATIKDHSERLAQVEADIATLGGADNGSIADAIEAAVAPVRQAAANADAKAQGAVDVNATQQTSIDDHETRIGAAEGAIAQEVTDRQNAINGLVNNASTGYKTLKDIEDKVKAAQKAADDAQADADQLNTDLGELEGRVGTVETGLADEITNRTNAISGLVNNASAGYKTLKDIEDKVKAAQKAADDAQSDADQLEIDLGNLEERVGTNETNIGTLRGEMDVLLGGAEITNSVAWQVAAAVTDIRDGVDEKYDTLKEVAEWIAADTTGAAKMSAAIDDHEQRIAAAEATIGDHTTAIAQEVTDRQNAINGLKGSTSKLHTLAALETALGTTDGNVATLNADLGELEVRVGVNETNIDNNDKAIKQEVTDRQNAISGLKGSTSKLHTLAAIESALGTTDSNVSQLTTDLGNLEERVGTNETNIDNNDKAIKQEVTDRGTAINNLRTEIQGGTLETDYNTMVKLQNKIKAEAAINATQNTTLEDYETRIAALEAQLQWGSF